MRLKYLFLVAIVAAFTFAMIAVFASTHAKKHTAPFEASYYGAENELTAWLQNGGNPNLTDAEGFSLLDLATGPKGSAKAVAVLLKFGANPNLVSNPTTYSPLMNASSWGKFESVRILVEAGANVTYKSKNGRSAMDVIGSPDRNKAIYDYLKKATSEVSVRQATPDLERR